MEGEVWRMGGGRKVQERGEEKAVEMYKRCCLDFDTTCAGLAVYAQDMCEALAEGWLLGSHWHSPHFGKRVVPFCGLGQKNHYIQR